jgi:hypothetical protein
MMIKCGTMFAYGRVWAPVNRSQSPLTHTHSRIRMALQHHNRSMRTLIQRQSINDDRLLQID